MKNSENTIEELLAFSEKSRLELISLLDQQQQKIAQLQDHKINYESLFENTPIALWEEDFSEVKKYIDTKNIDLDLLETYFDEHPNELYHLISLIKIVNINKATLELYKAKSKTDLTNNLDKIFTINSLTVFKELIIKLLNNTFTYETESVNVNLEGAHILIKLKYNVVAGFENTLERIVVSVIDITQERKINEKLMQSEQLYKEAQAVAHFGNWHIDYKTNTVTRSLEIFNILEVSKKEFKPTYDAFKQLIQKDDFEAYQQIFNEAIKKNISYEFSFRIVTPNGNIKYVLEKGYTFCDENNQPIRTVGTLQDITEKVLFENELEKTKEALENTFNILNEGFISVDKNWNYTFINPKAATLLNSSIENLIGKNIWTEFPEDVGSEFYIKCHEAQQNNKIFIFDQYFEPWNRWFENRIYPTNEGLSIFFQDITDHKNIEQKTQEAHNVIINSNSIAIVWENIPTWPTKYVSENIERILGYTAQEMKDDIIHFSKIMHPDDLENSNKEAFLYLNNSEVDDYILSPYRVYTKEGKIRWIAERTNVIRNEKGEAIELRGFIDDITEQYQLENGINTILNSVSKVTGNKYLKEITIQLSNVLEAEHTFIGLIDSENNQQINTLFNCFKGEIVDNFSYNLDGTPCANVLTLEACSFPKNVFDLFPEDLLLKEMGIEGYVGVPLLDSHNHPIGIMVALYKNPIENAHFAESIIQLFSTRTSAEIERLRTEEKLKETETSYNKKLNQLNIAIDATKDVVFMTDNKGIFTYVNKEFTRIYGYKPNELIGKTTPRILKSGLLPNDFYHYLWNTLYNKQAVNVEIKNKCKDGKLIDIESSLSTVTNEQEEIIGFIAIQRDITEKIENKKLLKESEKKYRDLFEKSEDATLLIKNNLFVDCNLATLKMLEFKGTKEDFLHIHPSEISPLKQPDGRLSKEKTDELIALVIEKGALKFEWVHLKSNQEEFYAEVTLTKIVSEDDDFIHCIWRDITSKKIAEEQLKVSEAEAWSLFEDATYPIWIEDFSEIKIYFDQLKQKGITDLDTYLDENPENLKEIADLIKVIKVNNSSLAFYDVDSKETLFRHISDFFINASYNSFKAELVALFDGKLSYKSELPIRKLNGQIAHIVLSASVPEVYKDTLEKVIVSFVDITEQKRSEQTKEVLLNISKKISEAPTLEIFSAIVKNELSVLIDTSNFYIGLYNKETDIITIPYFIDDLDEEIDNDGNFEAEGSLTGYVIKTKKSLLADQEIFANLVKDGHVKLIGPNSQVWLGVPFIVKNEVIGAIAVQSYTNSNAFTNEDLKLLEIVAEQIAIAIERIQHQNKIKESEEKFRTIFELSPDMILVLDINGIILDCNDKVLENIQYHSKNQIVGRNVNDVFRKGENQNAINVFQSLITETSLNNKELQFRQNDGNYITVEVSGTFIKNEKPENCLVVGVARDITERKKHEDDLNKALEKAKEADRLKSAFLANMSHEIRTPMNGIIGFAEMLQSQDLHEEKRAFYAHIIMNSSRQLLAIINDVLDMSTIEAGLVEIKKAPVSINEMLRELHEFFLQKSDEKQLNLICEKPLSDAESVINTDQTKVQQVLTNFISNAIKFTKKGSVTFGYTLKNNYLEFYVTDTGVGIEKIFHQEIFERFRQVNIEYHKETIGNGLGLSISKKLIELLDGKIWLESEPNKGSTFYFTLPYHQDVLEIIEEKSTPKTFNAMNEKITILIAEDEENNRIFIKEVLENDKINILTAENGVEAIEIAKNNPEIKFIFMDIKMPKISGIEALNAIREFNKTVPIIALTAFSMESDRVHLMNQGFDDYVAKPIVKKDLMRIIEKFGN